MGPNRLRVLLVYPNISMFVTPPTSLALFTGILRAAGHEVSLFDCTPYVQTDDNSPTRRVKYLQYRPFSLQELGHRPKSGDMVSDFAAMVDDFRPGLLLVSVVEDTYQQAAHLLAAVEDRHIRTVIGGPFCTAAPERMLVASPTAFVAVGEGEDVVAQVAERTAAGRGCSDVPGLCFMQRDGSIQKNPRGPLVDIEKPLPDYSLFDGERFTRTMGGRTFRIVPLETYRGCPYLCSFCNSPLNVSLAKESGLGNFMRRKRMNRLREEIIHLIETVNPEYLYMVDDVFLARPDEEIIEFCEMYREFRIPWWMNTRPENITPERLDRLRDVGCDRIAVGVECGNEEYRRRVLFRNYSNEKLLTHLAYLDRGGIAFSLNNIIGMPDETRDLIFETIEVNRQVQEFDTLTVSIFTPYRGTKLRDYAVAKGYLDADAETVSTTSRSVLSMPSLTADEIDGLMRTFPLYVRLPASCWPEIRQAEHDAALFTKLSEEFQRSILGSEQRLPPVLAEWDAQPTGETR